MIPKPSRRRGLSFWSSLKFSEDGANVVVVPEDGEVGRVFVVRPRSRALRGLKKGSAQGGGGGSEDKAVKVCSLFFLALDHFYL